ncbi:unnamed protein product [Cunninghamella blakesleeana]
MSDLHWCPTCERAIQSQSNSLYCSEECLRKDAITHHPMLGYDFAEFKDFPRRSSSLATPSLLSLSPVLSTTSSVSSVSPTLSPYALQSSSSASSYYSSSLNDDILHLDSSSKTTSHHHLIQNNTNMHKPKTNHNIFFI